MATTRAFKMVTIRPNPFISPPLEKAVATDVDVQSPVAREFKTRSQEQWQQLIDYQLIEWGCELSGLDEDGTETPSKETIQVAIYVATVLGKQGLPTPTRIVCDAHGGIVFERQASSFFESIRVSADQSVEYVAFEGLRLVKREPWPLA